jgi:DNA-binding response OmpR family regulator
MDVRGFIFGPRRLVDLKPAVAPGQLRKRVKTVVIDDEESSFPFKLLQDDGYTIEWWPCVDSRKLQRLESADFDIIILDIVGVAAPGLSSTDGLGVLRRVKSVNSSQVVVAFSGQSFDLSKTEFWRLADDALSKPVTIIKCKELLDRLINERITLPRYWGAISELMRASGVSNRDVNKLEKQMVRALAKGDIRALETICQKIPSTLSNAASVVTLVEAVMRLWL